MSTMIFVNLPVKDLSASIAFFGALGYPVNPQFTDENAASIVIDDNIVAMLLTESYFATFTDKEVADATKTTEVIVALGAESRARVDELVDTALASGATALKEPQDHGFMYQRSFQDLDGHLWEIMWMDPSTIEQG